jgi:Mn2+/Fe2+ NRAMP family transporter
MDSTPEYNHSEVSASSTTKRISRAIIKYNVLAHAFGFIIAVLLSLVIMAVALYMLIDSFESENKKDTAWAQTVIGFILGVWVTDKPKFVKKKKNKVKQVDSLHV